MAKARKTTSKIKQKEKIATGIGPISFLILILGATIGAAYVGSMFQDNFLDAMDGALGDQGKKKDTGVVAPPPPAPINFN